MVSDAHTSLVLPDAIVGDFRGNAAATGFRLILALDHSFTLDYWRDLGGRWEAAARGEYSVDGSLVRFVTPKGPFTPIVEVPFAIRDIQGHIVLVPAQSCSELDQAITAGAWHLWNGMISVGSLRVFTKQPLPRAVACTNADTYGHALTCGKRYLVLEERDDGKELRLFGDQGRLRWFPSSCFDIAAQRPTT